MQHYHSINTYIFQVILNFPTKTLYTYYTSLAGTHPTMQCKHSLVDGPVEQRVQLLSNDTSCDTVRTSIGTGQHTAKILLSFSPITMSIR
jgi:hypothetical protein